MDSLYELEIQFIIFLQSIAPWLRGPMEALSFLGTETFYLLVAPALVWCLDPVWGLRTGLVLMISGAVNYVGKLIGTGPRPYWVTDTVQPWSAETSFGVPSGHAQNGAAVWGALAAGVHKPWAWVVAALLALLIGVSRLFLGVHFPHDVLVGWLLGALILTLVLRLEKPVLGFLNRYKAGDQILFALGASLVLILAGAVVRLLLGNWQVPADWAALAARATLAEPINPLELSGLVNSAGVFFGLAAGAILLRERGWYNARGPWVQLIARFLVGLAGILVLWYGLGLILPRGETILPLLLRYLRYTLIGGWVIFGAPETFIKLKLAGRAITN